VTEPFVSLWEAAVVPTNGVLRDQLLHSLQESVPAEPASRLAPIDLTEVTVRRRRALPILAAAAVLVTMIGIVATSHSSRTPNIRTEPTTADLPPTTVGPIEVVLPCGSLPSTLPCPTPAVTEGPTTTSRPSGTPATTLVAMPAASGVLASGESRGEEWQLAVVPTPTDNGFECVAFSGGSVTRNICMGGGGMGVTAVPGFMAVLAFAPPDTQLPQVTTGSGEFLELSTVGSMRGMTISIGVTPNTNPIVAVAPGERCDYRGILQALDTPLPGADVRLDNVLIDHCRDNLARGSSAPSLPGYQTAQVLFMHDANGWKAGPPDHMDPCFELDPSGVYEPLCSRLGYVPGYRQIAPIPSPKETADLPPADGPWLDGVYWAYVKEVADGGHRLTVEIRKMVHDCARYRAELELPDCPNDYGLLRGSVIRTISRSEYFGVELSNGADPSQAFATTPEEFARLAALGDGAGKDHYEGTPAGFVFRLSPLLITVEKGKVVLVQTLVVP
jgi:hypothetical protein